MSRNKNYIFNFEYLLFLIVILYPETTLISHCFSSAINFDASQRRGFCIELIDVCLPHYLKLVHLGDKDLVLKREKKMNELFHTVFRKFWTIRE
jgi:hypothetical protein